MPRQKDHRAAREKTYRGHARVTRHAHDDPSQKIARFSLCFGTAGVAPAAACRAFASFWTNKRSPQIYCTELACGRCCSVPHALAQRQPAFEAHPARGGWRDGYHTEQWCLRNLASGVYSYMHTVVR
jgi:hypothetical protein